ncbi:sulfurtransferase [Cohnella abietis]|uniref:Sulfurtransferase n=1 Tax=Cohnella abietis TaxID=2507935 RepID=A0A3T1D7J0_9BACL|nr:sulfurtransferase [Cohnella abietis]BBI34057.1 sulfurtransferase [Cohnella abietis]
MTVSNDIIVDTDWLESQLHNPQIRIIDVRKNDYLDGHIPGAVNAPGWTYFTDSNAEITGNTSPDDFREKAEKLGINDDSIVVVYDIGNQYDAPRLFFLLEYYGHRNVKWLNGGYKAWVQQKKEIQKDNTVVQRGTFTPIISAHRLVDKAFILDNLENSNVAILDVRSSEEYSGEKSMSKREGRIPRSLNWEWGQVFTSEDVPLLKTSSEINKSIQAFEINDSKTIVPYCQQNIRASVMYLALRSVGFDHVRPYEGSWEEWGNDPNTPIEKG